MPATYTRDEIIDLIFTSIKADLKEIGINTTHSRKYNHLIIKNQIVSCQVFIADMGDYFEFKFGIISSSDGFGRKSYYATDLGSVNATQLSDPDWDVETFSKKVKAALSHLDQLRAVINAA